MSVRASYAQIAGNPPRSGTRRGNRTYNSDVRRCVSGLQTLALLSIRTWLAVTIALVAIALAIAPSTSPAAPNDISVDFGWSPTAPTPGQVVTFTATATPRGDPRRELRLGPDGDGTVDTHGPAATWSYAAPGPVTVRLRVKGKGSRRGEAVHTVSVQAASGGPPRPPVASFTIAPAAPVANQPVLFTSTSSDPDGTIN